MLSKLDYIVNEANKINGQASSETLATINKKSNEEIATEVIAGKWGNGQDRFNRLAAAGYDGNSIQNRVNEILGAKNTISNKKSNETIANEIIQGKWGNGQDRKNKLKAAGYDYNVIQAIVNQKLK